MLIYLLSKCSAHSLMESLVIAENRSIQHRPPAAPSVSKKLSLQSEKVANPRTRITTANGNLSLPAKIEVKDTNHPGLLSYDKIQQCYYYDNDRILRHEFPSAR